ncbi:MAG: hypothetical protein M0P49_00740 [Bacilli bacterium]|jgi:hypothetical protein|nr:hypothetical protein [Bacilli bacterium]
MIQIINKSKDLTTNQIERIINILPNEYRELDIELIFPRSKFQCLSYIYLRNYYENVIGIFTGWIRGLSCEYYNKCFVYTFNFYLSGEYGGIQKLYMIHTIYHEIYHQWQKLHHIHDDVEKGADKFANNLLNNKYNEIIEIISETF